MKRLYILYDDRCGFCREVKFWAERQPAFLELIFLPAGSPRANKLFPELAPSGRPEELIVVSDEGGIYRDTQAYIMCLYALMEYREWSLRLATPALMPLARKAFHLISKNRLRISELLNMEGDKLVERLNGEPPPFCDYRIHCPYCKASVQPKDAVHCPECSTIHHRECWIRNDYHCSIFGCAEKHLQGVSR
jgi:predicted DCC family thiol-disulfide oxidoreductase YuxK